MGRVYINMGRVYTDTRHVYSSYIDYVFFYTSYTFLHSKLTECYLQGVGRRLSTPFLHLIYTIWAFIYTFWSVFAVDCMQNFHFCSAFLLISVILLGTNIAHFFHSTKCPFNFLKIMYILTPKSR